MKGAWRYFLTLFFPFFLAQAQLLPVPKTFVDISLDKNLKEKILQGDLLAVSKVTDSEVEHKKFQHLDFYVTGLHQKSCSFALVKLSQYENYKNYLNFVSQSRYDESLGRIHLLLETKILPTKMILNFKIPRINKEGSYSYEFDQGFLKGLRGTINVSAHGDRCFFYTDAFYYGPHTGYPNFLFEFFSQTLSKLSIQSLFRISQTLK
jgi:hypothetical protein